MMNSVVFIVTGSGLRGMVARDLARGRAQAAIVATVSPHCLVDRYMLDEHLLIGTHALIIDCPAPLSAQVAERTAQRFLHDTIQAYRRMAEPVLVRTPVLLFTAPKVLDLPRDHSFLKEIRV